MTRDDAIYALATPDAPAALAIVRTSGPGAFDAAASLGAGELIDRTATRVRLRFAGLIVPATVHAFRGPRSHTGEDVVEYLIPGSPPLVKLLLQTLADRGLRQAEPGEFSARAFFNGKLALDVAEGVAATISATSDRQLAAAAKLRGGELARRLAGPTDALADLAALCELGIDFADEDVSVLPAAEAVARIDSIAADLRRLKTAAPTFERLGRPPRVALVGRANAGKSTLFNALVGKQRAVASPLAGTTRDALTADLDLPGGRVTLVDLAGLEPETLDDLDAAGQAVAAREAADADVLVLVRDASDERDDPPLPRPPDLIVRTKADLTNDAADVSALTGTGLDALRTRIADLAFAAATGDALALTARHHAGLDAALQALADARLLASIDAGAELVAHALRRALDALGGVVGLVSPDDLLSRVFSRFCIGK